MPSLDLVISRVLHHYLKRWYKIAMSEGVSSVLQRLRQHMQNPTRQCSKSSELGNLCFDILHSGSKSFSCRSESGQQIETVNIFLSCQQSQFSCAFFKPRTYPQISCILPQPPSGSSVHKVIKLAKSWQERRQPLVSGRHWQCHSGALRPDCTLESPGSLEKTRSGFTSDPSST